MAESKFLKYQDPSGVGLPDVCEDVIDVAEVPCEDCKCIPNGAAITPNWRTVANKEAFVNYKTCVYQVVIETPYTTTIDESILETDPSDATIAEAMYARFDEFADQAVEALLDAYDRDDGAAATRTIKDALTWDIESDYYLAARAKSRLRLLYSVPYNELCAIGESANESDADANADDSSTDIEVTYEIQELKGKLIHVRKGLHLDAMYLRVYHKIDGGNLFYEEGDLAGLVFPLEDYGDRGILGGSIMGQLLPQLDNFLNRKKLNIRGVGGVRGMFGDRVEKITFRFTDEYEIKKLLVYTEECGEKPIIFMKKLSWLKRQEAWSDPTALAYLAQLTEMENDLMAREPVPWLEFVKKYTYPTIYPSINQGYTNTDPENSAGSCVADALQNELKQLGEDILDEAFSIGDAIAFQFHKNLCRATLGEVVEDEIEIGLIWDPNKDMSVEIEAMAAEQAAQTLQQDDAHFDELCAKVISKSIGGIDALEQIWEEGFDKIKLCGLYSILIDSIQCLFGGLSLEESLSTIIKNALEAMSLQNFGDLFVGLPPEKQAELDALVKKKLENGDLFKEGSVNQQTSDVLAGKLDYTKPWEDEALVEEQNATGLQPGSTGETMTATEIQDTSENSRRTLAQQLDVGSSAKKQLSPNIVFQAYILALLEVYSDNYFELLEELNKFPGAELIAHVIATLDCPLPPVFEPSFLDFVKDVELPFCQNVNDVTLPALQNPFGFIPSTFDLTSLLFEAAKFAIQQAIVALLLKLMVKLCEVLGNAACGAIPNLGGDADGIADLIRDSICGDDADPEQIDDTITDMFANLGVGAVALADPGAVTNFAQDISSAVTQPELCDAFLGRPSPEFLQIVQSLIEYEYPQFQEGLRNQAKIGTFFKNMGNLMPASFREQLRDCADDPVDDRLPANPSLCATPDQLEEFCELRSQILDGRATPAQIEKLCERPVDDLSDLAGALQGGLPSYLADNLPPLFSEPGCDDGLLPYEPEEVIAVATAAMSGMMQQLKSDFAEDMMGNGPGEGKWGLLNMILSDTMGNPLTAHTRKVDNRRDWVNFYTETGISVFADTGDDSAMVMPKQAMTARQKGAFPYKIADWLEEYMQTKLTPTFTSNNELKNDYPYSKSYEDAGVTTFGGGIDLLKLPDLGYNVEVRSDFENQKLKYIKKARKADPDMTLNFQDNCNGLWDDEKVSEMYSYGFSLEFYLSDLVSGSAGGSLTSLTRPTARQDTVSRNRPDDNVRIKIYDIMNAKANTFTALAASIPDILKYLKPLKYKIAMALLKPDNDEIAEVKMRQYEFLASDNTLDEIDLSPYPRFLATFEGKQNYLPQIVLLDELISNENASADFTKATLKSTYDDVVTNVTQTFIDEIANNDSAFLYGATYDNLSFDDVEYVVDDDQTDSPGGTNYYEAVIIDDEGEERTIRRDDQILGLSKMQYMSGSDVSRVTYLDPMTFGGSYMNPPIYVSPLQNKGWLGLVDVMFPDLSPCKPYRTDLIDFEDIDKKIEDSYPTIPEDERLKSDPNCVVEVPYARILDRSSVAGIESVITSAIRIYVTTSFMKSIATFTKFSPSFTDVFSSVYAAYVVEEMEASFKDAQKAIWERFNPFKDNEFWYAFLEQAVQLYSRRIDSGEISNPPSSAIQALGRLNDMQERYHYPYKEDLDQSIDWKDVVGAAAAGAATPMPGAGLAAGIATFAAGFKTLKEFRQQQNLEAIQATEEDAKMVLKELVVEQLNYVGGKFVENLKILDMSPTIFDLDYYVLQNLSQGGESLTLGQEIQEEYSDLPTEGEGYYTNGNEFAQEDGTEYVGYYHVETPEGSPIYVTGESGGDSAAGAILAPMAKKIIVPIGDVAEYGSAVSDTSSTSVPFVIEKYISINGAKYASSTAVSTIKSVSDQSQNISDVYPGTMELVTDQNGQVVGTTGELGVRHGLQFSMLVDGDQFLIADAEIDALDRPLGQIDPIEADSKLLLCLINNLKEDERFKLTAKYIFPLNKLTATLAIYNGMAFLPSIGEKMVKDNQTTGRYYWGESDDLLPDLTGRSENTIYTKPGMALTFDDETGGASLYPPDVAGPDTATDDSSFTEPAEEGGFFSTDKTYELPHPDGGGWSSKLDRDPGLFGGLFVKEWDNWDKTLLRNSKSRLKKIFKSYYNAREFKPGDTGESEDSPGTIVTAEFKERFKSRPGQNLLPWWKRRMLRTNPFNADGEMCEKKD